MSAIRIIRVGFFQPEFTGEAEGMEWALARLYESPADETRTVTINDIPVRLQKLIKSRGVYEGEFMKIRMDNLPPIASLAGRLDLFELAEDQGLGEQCAFLYDPALNVLAVELNRRSASPVSISRYIEAMTGCKQVSLLPILTADAIRRFATAPTIRKIDLRVAGIRSGNPLRDGQHSTLGFLDLMDELKAPTLNLTISMGSHEGGMLLGKARQLIRRLLRLGEETGGLSRLRVSAYTEEGENLLLDLVEDRIEEHENVMEDSKRRVPYANRRSAVARAFERRRNELALMMKED